MTIFVVQFMKIPTRLLYWFEMPLDISETTVSEEDSLEFLKRDILLISLPYSKINSVLQKFQNDVSATVFAFNLDNILVMARASSDGARESFCKTFADSLFEVGPERCIIHSKIMDAEIEKIFKSRQIRFFTMNTVDHRAMIAKAMGIIEPIFKQSPQKRPVSLVLQYYPEKKMNAVLVSESSGRKVEGWVKRLWLNGVSIVLKQKENLQLFDRKNIVTVSADFIRFRIQIHKSIIAGMDDTSITVVYNILNPSMISADEGKHLIKELHREMNYPEI